ncbi:hephaestin-like protein [Haliotis rufescens]|uniref:hephaestin-like protein n=1 Tax=Haliotis rufescens TaxID=6454 RepID=UPI00201E87B3|nr:hephaestin-like protein [Haliotis rufescens]
MPAWCVIGLMLILTAFCNGVDRHYYIGCVEVLWDYAPSGDLVTPTKFNITSPSKYYLYQGHNLLGRVYKKAVYKQYTDATYSVEIEKPKWLGFLGPILKGEEGDTLLLHFKNFATQRYSMHPHGLLYNKTSEGAKYHDGYHNMTSDDLVWPGGSHTYRWEINKQASPSPQSPDCISWIYHSHVVPTNDTNAGLVGFIYTCKPGILDKAPSGRQYAIYASQMDENRSWYMQDNLHRFGGNISTINKVNVRDNRFRRWNTMPALNGYVYGNLPGLDACVGETVTFHFAAMGHAKDMHQLAISGHSFKQFGHIRNSISLEVAQFATVTVKALAVGRWLLYDEVMANFVDGMTAFFNVGTCSHIRFKPKMVPPRNVRRYYIAAEEILWNYAPSHTNKYEGGTLRNGRSKIYFEKNRTRIGGTYKKAVFTGYTDTSFKIQKQRSPSEEHLGFLGPVIKAEVGDAIEVHFLNRASRPYSLHPHGVQCDKDNEGMLYNDNHPETSKKFVPPGRVQTYYWKVPEYLGPETDDPNCVIRVYTSGTDIGHDIYSGLVGPLVVCRKGEIKKRTAVREFFLYFSIVDENFSWYLEDNIKLAKVDHKVNRSEGQFLESNRMSSINGFMYGNVPGLAMCRGEVIRWYAFNLGTDIDLHTLYFHGNMFENHHQHKVSTGMISGALKTLIMSPRNIGTWGLQCHSNDHFLKGMSAMYQVTECPVRYPTLSPRVHRGRERIFYLQAEEGVWDYTPHHMDMVQGVPFITPDRRGTVYTNHTGYLMGTKYKKMFYKQYKDKSFRYPVKRKSDEAYLGFLGPVIYLEVGDILTIRFRNKGQRPYSIHPEGLQSITARLGPWMPKQRDQGIVQPGKTFSYQWEVTKDDGPGPSDAPCVSRMYYSDVDAMKDTNSGLVGPLVICKSGILDKYGKRTDVDRDFVAYFTVLDENFSWYLEENIATYSPRPDLVDRHNKNFTNSNRMHVINGFLYGNQPIPTMYKDEEVAWYLLSLGSQFDLHSIHFHGNLVTEFSDTDRKNDVTQIFPGMFVTVRMRAINTGRWLYHCHVNNHIKAGMEGMYQIMDRQTAT